MKNLATIRFAALAIFLLVTGGVLSRLLFPLQIPDPQDGSVPQRERVAAPEPGIQTPGVGDAKRSATDPAETLGVDGANSPDDTEPSQEQFELRVQAGLIDRSEIGDARVDEILRRRARTILAELPAAALVAWRAKQCGFMTIAKMETFESQVSSLEQAKQDEFLALRDAVDEVIPIYQECRVAAWESGRAVEVVDPSNRHDSALWAQSRGLDDASTSLVANTSDVSVGDRVFRFYFRSSEFPQLESRMRRIGELRSNFLR